MFRVRVGVLVHSRSSQSSVRILGFLVLGFRVSGPLSPPPQTLWGFGFRADSSGAKSLWECLGP